MARRGSARSRQEEKGAPGVRRNPRGLGQGGNSHRFWVVITFLLVFHLPPSCLFPTTLEELPIDHWAYNLIERLQERGHFGELLITDRPYTRLEVARYVIQLEEKGEWGELSRSERSWVNRLERELEAEIARLEGEDPRENRPFSWRIGLWGSPRADLKEDSKELEPPYESIRFGGDIDPDVAFQGEMGGALQYSDRFVLVDRLLGDTEPRNEPEFRIRREGLHYRNFRFPEAYFSGVFGPLSILFGRHNIVWGHGPENALTISGVSPPFDMIRYRLGVLSLQATGFLAMLDRTAGSDGLYSRYLYAHKLSWRAKPWLQVGVSETVLVTGVGRGIDFNYLNPLLFLASLQWEESATQVNTNNFSSVDWSLYLSPGIFLSGELLVDELLHVRTEQNQDFSRSVAFYQGLVWSHSPLPDGMSLELSYTRIGSFTYLHRGEATYYSHYDAPIGSPLGPDTDQWLAGVSYPIVNGFDLAVDYRHRRRGENRLEPAVSAEGHRGEPFPTGVVEKRSGPGVTWEWFPADFLRFRGEFVYTRVENLNNQDGVRESISNLELSLDYLFDIGGSFSNP